MPHQSPWKIQCKSKNSLLLVRNPHDHPMDLEMVADHLDHLEVTLRKIRRDDENLRQAPTQAATPRLIPPPPLATARKTSPPKKGMCRQNAIVLSDEEEEPKPSSAKNLREMSPSSKEPSESDLVVKLLPLPPLTFLHPMTMRQISLDPVHWIQRMSTLTIATLMVPHLKGYELWLCSGVILPIIPPVRLYQGCGHLTLIQLPQQSTMCFSWSDPNVELYIAKAISLLPRNAECPLSNHFLEEIPIWRLQEELPLKLQTTVSDPRNVTQNTVISFTSSVCCPRVAVPAQTLSSCKRYSMLEPRRE